MIWKVLGALALFALGAPLAKADEIIATTRDGKKVVLYENGTWKYADSPQKAVSAAGSKYEKSSAATEKIDLLRGKAALYYNPSKWRNLKETEPGRFELSHKDGDTYAVVIAERMQMSLDTLRNIALNNAREVAPDAATVAQEKRMVNGGEILFMQTHGTAQGIPFVYLGYYYTGELGTVQILTYTVQNLLDEYRQEMEEFLNGFQVQQP